MKRRYVIAGTAMLATYSGCLDESDSDSDDGDSEAERDDRSFEVTTVDGPGSEAGTVDVPTDGQIQLVNFIRVTCPTSRAMLSRVGEARDRLEESYDVGRDGAVHVMTLIDATSGAQPSESELGDWWADQDGDWTVGIDESGDLFEYHEVTGTPTTVAIDGAGEVHFRDEGGTTANSLISGVETALEAADTSES